MLVISYDIADDLTRSRFNRMLLKQGAIRLKYSVYEKVNSKRIVDNLLVHIQHFAKRFTKDDSIIIFDVDKKNLVKYGSAIHMDQDIVFI